MNQEQTKEELRQTHERIHASKGVALDSAAPTTLDGWEELCEGTYPGYSVSTGEEVEARAYAALTEILDEVNPHDLAGLVAHRQVSQLHPDLGAKGYEHDQRLTDLVMLLLHHGWTPPEDMAYTDMTPLQAGNQDAGYVSPLDLERLDYGAIMEDLNHDQPSKV